MHTTDQWSGIFHYSSTPNLTQVSCWYLEVMACVRSGSNTELSAITCLSWSSVIKTIPVAILHFEQTVTALLINSWLDISTAPRSLLEETVIPLWSIWRNCAQKSLRHRIPLRGSHVDDSGSCMSSPEQEKGERICVALDIRSWLLVSRKPLLFRSGPVPTTKSRQVLWDFNAINSELRSCANERKSDK